MRDLVLRVLRASPPLRRLKEAIRHPTNRGHRVSAVVRVLHYQLNTGVLRRPTIVPLGRRSRIVAYAGETNSHQAVMRNPPNWPEMLVWSRALKPGDLFVDVGANIGIYTIWACEQGAQVVAVEPNARNAARVREHLALNGYPGEVINKALADTPGVVRMTVGLDSFNRLTSGDEKGEAVEATTLDELIGARVASVKIDVEGAEALVLRGATSALRNQRIRLMQLEWVVQKRMNIGDRGEVSDLLTEFGYELRVANHDGSLRIPAGDEPLPMNVFALPG